MSTAGEVARTAGAAPSSAMASRQSRPPITRVLLVEDNAGDARLLLEMFTEQGSHDTTLAHVTCMKDAETHLRQERVDIVLLDLGLPDTQGLQGVGRVRAAAPRTPLVVLTGLDDETLATQALQAGAQDYLVKGQFETRSLLRGLRYAIERKNMEERYRSVVEQANDAILLYEPTLRILEANHRAEELLGCPREQIVGRSYETFIAPEDLAVLAADGAILRAEGASQGLDRRLLRADGTLVCVDVSASLIRNGEETVVLAIVHDISERKRSEERLAESAEEYRLLFEDNPQPMWVFDVETLAFLAVNDAAVRLYGFSREEFLAMTVKEIRHSSEIPGLLEYLAAMPASPTMPAELAKHRRKDGSALEISGASSAIEFRGRHARLVLAVDVTEKKGLEAQLAQAQKMEAVGRLAGGVAHDFNNLLGVITGYSELLLKNLGPLHAGTKRVEQIQKAAERAASLTRQLLAFSRKQVWQPRILDLNEVVGGVARMLRRVIGEDIRVVTTPGANLGRIKADPGQIEQILMNLVVNARDAMPKGGGLSVATANVTLDEAYARSHPDVQPGPFVMLSVRDTGSGIDPTVQAHMFEPFYTTKDEGKGTGLGLSTVFGIVQQSGGSISVDSGLGVGTTFKIYFPRVEDALTPQTSPGTTPARGKETILLVEDADSLRLLVREILEDGGYTVVDSSDAEEALLTLSSLETRIHLMLTDVVMPRMSGPDLARSVRIARPEIRVLFMSGYTHEAMGLHGMLDAGTQFIQKPFAADALLAKVREAIDGAEGLS